MFVSSDRDDASFNEYFRSHHGGWLALPRTSAKKGSLSSRFDVEGIPTLAIVDKDGKTITTDGVESVAGDRGAGFPYKPKTVRRASRLLLLPPSFFLLSLPPWSALLVA